MKPASAKTRWKGCYRHSKTPQEYLSQRVERQENGCLIYTKCKDKDGYGQVHASRVAKDLGVTRAHQMAWVMHNGPIPEGMFVCHTCDNPSCVEITHLFVGTAAENNQDKINKGRDNITGVRRPVKLTDSDLLKIKALKGQYNCMQLAEMFNVSFSRICGIWRGEHAPIIGT